MKVYTIVVYLAWDLGLTYHILQNLIGSTFFHLPLGVKGNNIQGKLIKSNQGIKTIQSDQRIELIKLNQGMGLIKSDQDIQSWWISRFSIMTDVKMPNHFRQDTQSRWVCLGILFKV